jgi:hypothetical protein
VKLVRKYELDEEYKSFLIPTIRNIIQFYNKYKDYKSVEEEDFEFKDDTIWIYGQIDKLMRNSSNLICIDYKTAKSANRDRFVFQMRFYNLILSKRLQLDPSIIKCIIYFPRPDVEDKFMFSNKEINLFEGEIRNKIVEIETNTIWEAHKDYHCRWCEFFNTPHCLETYRRA